jgi:hypothetical protein
LRIASLSVGIGYPQNGAACDDRIDRKTSLYDRDHSGILIAIIQEC